MKKLITIQKIVITLTAFLLIVCCLTYRYNISAVSKKSEEIEFKVKENETFSTLGDDLYNDKLIRSEFFYKLYIKLFQPKNLQAGIYKLNKNMSLKEIIDVLSSGSANQDVINITFKEGINMRKVISLITENTDNTENDVLNTLKDKEYLNELIKKYWFIEKDILNENIYYSLEGYLYPNTYQINKKWNSKQIFEVLLNEMKKRLEDYKEYIEDNEYNIHEILTLASIIELEGSNSNDRSGIAGVFFNRLENGWSLGSDVTTYYGVKIDLNERDLYQSEIDEYNSYNTRSVKMAGKLPVGPICNPSIESIEAVIKPSKHNYFYFVADKNGKTYFTKTSSEHIKIIKKLKSENLWYTYE